MINKIHLYDKIVSPVITEKSTNLTEQNKVTFKINKNTIYKQDKVRFKSVGDPGDSIGLWGP